MPVTPGPCSPPPAQSPSLGLGAGEELEAAVVHLADVARDDLADLGRPAAGRAAWSIGPLATKAASARPDQAAIRRRSITRCLVDRSVASSRRHRLGSASSRQSVGLEELLHRLRLLELLAECFHWASSKIGRSLASGSLAILRRTTLVLVVPGRLDGRGGLFEDQVDEPPLLLGREPRSGVEAREGEPDLGLVAESDLRRAGPRGSGRLLGVRVVPSVLAKNESSPKRPAAKRRRERLRLLDDLVDAVLDRAGAARRPFGPRRPGPGTA